jgi:hypothetical protein
VVCRKYLLDEKIGQNQAAGSDIPVQMLETSSAKHRSANSVG